MRILALDSATNVAGAAVVDEGELTAELFINTSITHSRKIMLLIDNVLNYSELTLSDIDGFALAIGPGSFTGLRIGLSTVKSLAFFVNKPVVGISTLDGLARNVPFASGLICSVIKARQDEVYSALYLNTAGGLARVSDYMAVSPRILLNLLRRLDTKDLVFVGDGIEMLPREELKLLEGAYVAVPPEHKQSRASTIGFLGLDKLSKGETDDVETLEPFYIRASAPEERHKNKQRDN